LQARINHLIALDAVIPSVSHSCSNKALSSVLTFAEMVVMSLVGICYHGLKFGLPVKKLLVSVIFTTSHERKRYFSLFAKIMHFVNWFNTYLVIT